MKPTQKLEQEHRTIERVANACGVFSEMLQNGRKVPADVLRKLVEFLRVYGQEYHQQEEEWLFSMLRQKGVPNGSCPIAVLSHEDNKLAVLVHQLANAVEAYSNSAGTVTGTLIDTLRALAELYPDHIWKEDYLLLPMAEKILSDGDQQVLAETLRMIDSAKGAAARQSVQQFSAAIKLCPECNNSPQEQRVA